MSGQIRLITGCVNRSTEPRTVPRIVYTLCLAAGWMILAVGGNLAWGQTGFRDFSYGSTCNSTPTGEKPESKLWINDGSWWGSLCSPSANKYHIYRLDLSTQTWVDTGTLLDDRSASKADTLWDDANQKLYVASHVFTTNGQPTTSSSQWGRLYRYSYNKTSRSYSLDSGFPVNITHGRSETLVLAKDSTGRLWVTWVENSKVMVNHSGASDLIWGDPAVLPVDTAIVTLSSDDISSIIAFQGNKIGLMWSNQLQKRFYFATHLDGAAATAWVVDAAVIPGTPCSGACGDDHIDLKTAPNNTNGRVFAAIKTSLTASNAPLVMLTVREPSGQWSSYVYGTNTDQHTRPVVLLNPETNLLYMFATSPESGGGIYYKSTDLNNINFKTGKGQPFILNSADTRINNASTTKQNLNSQTGLVVLASDQGTKRYLHNYLNLGAGSTGPLANFSGSPTAGPAPLTVQFSDLSSGSPTSWNWNFGDGVTSLQRNPSHMYSAAGNFTVSLTVSNSLGSNTMTRTNYIAVSASSASPIANFSGSPTTGQAPLTVQFSDLSSGSPASWNWGFGDGGTSLQQNPSHIYSAAGSYTVSLTVSNSAGSNTMTKTNYITVTVSGPGGSVVFSGGGTGVSSNSNQVTTTGSQTAVSGDIYLAAVATRFNVPVTSVSGLGLSWRLLAAQCAGRNQTAVSIWLAQGTPAGNGPVTAMLSATALNAVIAVSRYSGASTVAPIGSVVSGNTNGAGGACSGGTDTSTYSLSLTTTAPGAAIYGAVAIRNKSHTPGPGYAERAEVHQGLSGDVAGVATQDMSISTSSTTEFDGLLSAIVDWAAIGLEIKP